MSTAGPNEIQLKTIDSLQSGEGPDFILDATATDGLGFHKDPRCITSSGFSNGTRQHRNSTSDTLTRGPVRKRQLSRCLDNTLKGLLIEALEMAVKKPSVPNHYKPREIVSFPTSPILLASSFGVAISITTIPVTDMSWKGKLTAETYISYRIYGSPQTRRTIYTPFVLNPKIAET